MLSSIVFMSVLMTGPYPGWEMLSFETAITGGCSSGSSGANPQITVKEKAQFNEIVWGSDMDTYYRNNPGTGNYEEALKENLNLVISVDAINSGSLISFTNTSHDNNKFWCASSIQAKDLPDGILYADFIDRYRITDTSVWTAINDGFYLFQVPVRVLQPVVAPPVDPVTPVTPTTPAGPTVSP